MSFKGNPFKRRSPQLRNCKMLDSCPLGYFRFVPSHVVSMIFDCLSANDLGNFVLASKQTRGLFESYMKTKSTKKRFHLTADLHGEEISASKKSHLMVHFKQFGILMKRATCLYRTKQRLQIVTNEVFKLYNCHLYVHHQMIPKECSCLPLFGQFLQTLIRGWEYDEWRMVLDILQDESHVRESVQRIFACEVNEEPHLEMRVRHFYRSVFLDPFGNNSELAFWLTRILGKESDYQARFLFILYGPYSHGGVLQYFELCEEMPVMNRMEMQSRFLELARAIDVLHSHGPSKKKSLALLNCIKSLPDEWLPINFANLLTTLDKNLVILYLSTRAKEGAMTEVGMWFAYLAMIMQKYLWRMEGTVDILQGVFKALDTPDERYQLMENIQIAFHEETSEFHHTGLEFHSEIHFNLMLTATTEFNNCFLKKGIGQGIFKV